MELHHVAVRALFIYLALLGLMRLSGKRTVAEATAFSFVFALIVGDLIDDGLWAEVPMAQFVVATGTLAIIHLLVSWAAWRSEGIDRLVNGLPTAVLAGGRPQRRGLRRERTNEKELACEVRHHGLEREDWPEVEAAHVEVSGEVSVLRFGWARPVQRRDAAALRGKSAAP